MANPDIYYIPKGTPYLATTAEMQIAAEGWLVAVTRKPYAWPISDWRKHEGVECIQFRRRIDDPDNPDGPQVEWIIRIPAELIKLAHIPGVQEPGSGRDK